MYCSCLSWSGFDLLVLSFPQPSQTVLWGLFPGLGPSRLQTGALLLPSGWQIAIQACPAFFYANPVFFYCTTEESQHPVEYDFDALDSCWMGIGTIGSDWPENSQPITQLWHEDSVCNILEQRTWYDLFNSSECEESLIKLALKLWKLLWPF